MSGKNHALILLVLTVFVSAVLAAAPPALLNYQGVLRDASEAPLNGAHNMVFRFYNVDGGAGCVGGTLLLTDAHEGGGSGAVEVSAGLFNVDLGGGSLTPGTENSLTAVFRDNAAVWLEVAVEGETLCPRTRVISAGYALNADHLDGKSSGQFLRGDTSDAFTSGTLSVGVGATLDVAGTMNAAQFTDRDDGSYYLNPAGTSSVGVIRAAEFVDRDDTGYYLDPANDFTSGRLYSDLEIGYGSEHDWDRLIFDRNQEALIWADDGAGDGRFQLTDALAVDGPFQAGATTGIHVAYNRFGLGSPVSGQISNENDLMVLDDLEVGGSVYLNRILYMWGENLPVSDQDQSLFFYDDGQRVNEVFRWDDSQDEFWLSDDLLISGGTTGVEASGSTQGGYFLDTGGTSEGRVGYSGYGGFFEGDTAGSYNTDANSGTYARVAYGNYKIAGTGTVSFVQNHPADESRVIVYAAPEGDEVATYTRGTARLVDGEARVPLGETFRWVTNPDIGLTVYLTPVGDWSDLYVAEKSTSEILVRSAGGPPDIVFDYLVYGLRIGFEESSIVQEKKHESYVPSMKDHRDLYQHRPELRRFNALERFGEMRKAWAGPEDAETPDFGAAKALLAAVQEYDPMVHGRLEPFDLPQEDEVGASDEVVVPIPEMASLASRDEVSGGSAGGGSEGGAQAGTLPVDEEGTVYARSFRSRLADLASYVPVSVAVGEGDVLVVDQELAGSMTLSTEAQDPTVVGIATGEPGVALGARPEEGQASVALSGMVLCKVDAGYGGIRVGDLLATSPTPGHAMRADDPAPGTVLGKALEALDAGTGIIRVLVMLR